MEKVLFGCIADDFTGASDVCSFLVDLGVNCVLVNDVPEEDIQIDADVIVVALKIRSESLDIALDKVKKSIDFLVSMGATHIYDKYCSTFDSTEEGNIGPILDYLLERFDQRYSIVSPALPSNEREVFNGYLFADKQLLSEGSMKHHPLTPMRDSYLPRVLSKQSKYNAYSLDFNIIESGEIEIDNWISKIDDERFHVITDYFIEDHGEAIADKFKDLKVLSGSSALIRDWYKAVVNIDDVSNIKEYKNNNDKTIILSGSLSKQTKKQISTFIENGGKSISINPKEINDEYFEKIKKEILNSKEDILLYSDRENFDRNEETGHYANKLEDFYSKLSNKAYELGISKIIGAGGETSGAIIGSLPFKKYRSIKNIAPGVPVLRPLEDDKFQIVLKSGNFGQDDFFERAIKIMGE